MIYEMTVPASIRILKNLSSILDKAKQFADAKKIDWETFAHFRLAPDQFPLARQIQIACDTAKLSASRLTGKEAPKSEDNEKTFSDFKDRIANTVAYLETFKPEDFKNSATQKVTQPRWEGKWLTGEDYATHHVIPNLYFHVTTAYSILRHNGVEIGKKDYLGPLPFKEV
jgi:hypothetical protein